RPRRRKADPVDHVVEPALKQLQQRLARDAARPLRLLEVVAELLFEDAVDALHLLLLAQLHAVTRHLLPARLSMLARSEVALVDRALLGEAALALEEQFHALAAAETTNGSDVSSHSIRTSN